MRSKVLLLIPISLYNLVNRKFLFMLPKALRKSMNATYMTPFFLPRVKKISWRRTQITSIVDRLGKIPMLNDMPVEQACQYLQTKQRREIPRNGVKDQALVEEQSE